MEHLGSIKLRNRQSTTGCHERVTENASLPFAFLLKDDESYLLEFAQCPRLSIARHAGSGQISLVCQLQWVLPSTFEVLVVEFNQYE